MKQSEMIFKKCLTGVSYDLWEYDDKMLSDTMMGDLQRGK